MNQNDITRIIKSVAKLINCGTTYVTVEFFSSGDGQVRYGNLYASHNHTQFMSNKDFDGTWCVFSFRNWELEKSFIDWVDKHGFDIKPEDRLEAIFIALGV